MVLASVIAGASGGALANVALSPLGGGAGMLQSYWYGAGLILGERDMYTFHWEKIKKRLESGEDYLSVLEGEMTPAITAIANFSLQIMEKTSQIYLTAGVDMLAKLVENMLMLLAGEKVSDPSMCPEGFKWDSVMQVCRPTTVEQPAPEPEPTPTIPCPSGFRWSESAQQCVPEDIPEPEPVVIPPPVQGTLTKELQLANPQKYGKGRIVLYTYNFTDDAGVARRKSTLKIESNVAVPESGLDYIEGGKWLVVSPDLTSLEATSLAQQSWPLDSYHQFRPNGPSTWPKYYLRNL